MVYRVAGLPVALRTLASSRQANTDPLRAAFARRYWHPHGLAERSELIGAIILAPLAIIAASVWFTWRNGAVIRRRQGKSVAGQLAEQLRLYCATGALPPWYYIFSLHDDGSRRAPTFIQRFETKSCYFRVLKKRKGTPLNDKVRFAEHCRMRGIRSVPTIMYLDGDQPGVPLPDRDLFVKPIAGRGGRGAERWDLTGPSAFRGPGGAQLSGDSLLQRLIERSHRGPLLVQPRMECHPDLRAITSGALPTVRVLTCLNERSVPEVMAAMMRTSFGKNRTVDNLHAGGIGAFVDLESGKLSQASNLGSDARLGWFSTHPDSGAPIEGRTLPFWSEIKASAIEAHRQFSDRVVIGWDIAILKDGPIFIEGNGNPDLDILQRFMRFGFRKHRLAQLLAFHLQALEEGATCTPEDSTGGALAA